MNDWDDNNEFVERIWLRATLLRQRFRQAPKGRLGWTDIKILQRLEIHVIGLHENIYRDVAAKKGGANGQA